jgi:hypothetical protein
MKTCWPRRLMSIILMLSFSCPAVGADGSNVAGAVLHASGKVQVNGARSHEITALFSGDSIQTDEDSVANIVAGGSSVLVMPNASVKFTGHGVELTQGGVAIATSDGMAVTWYGLTIKPAAQSHSKFEVAESEDSVFVATREGNVTVMDGQQASTVQEGHEQLTRRSGAVDPIPPRRALSRFPAKLSAFSAAPQQPQWPAY